MHYRECDKVLRNAFKNPVPLISPLLTLNICQMSAWCLLGLGAGLVLASCLLCHSLKIKDITFQMRSHLNVTNFACLK